MSELQATLEAFGLQEYQIRLVKHGFDTWDNLANIKETDMATLGIKLGHRRKIQRENARRLGHPAKEPLSNPQARAQHTTEDGISYIGRSNYVAHARFLSQYPKVANLSLAETVKLVGEQWSIKDAWNTSAAEQKGTDDSQLTHYYQTEMCGVCSSCSKSGNLREAQCEAQISCNGTLPKNCRPHSDGGSPWSRGRSQAVENATTSFEFMHQYPCGLAQGSSTSCVC
jgi:hypothetical protein